MMASLISKARVVQMRPVPLPRKLPQLRMRLKLTPNCVPSMSSFHLVAKRSQYHVRFVRSI